jgi:hypothetical protein
LDVTIAPGEAFVGGWLCRDTSTTLTLPANSTTDIVIAHETDAIFDPAVDPDRDAADEVIVDLSSNVPADIPQVIAHRVETDGAGVVSSSQVATVGGFSQIATGNIETTDLSVNGAVTSSLNVNGAASVGDLTVNGEAAGIEVLIDVQTEANLPAIDPPQIAFIRDKNEYQRSVDAQGFALGQVSFQQSISPQDPQPRGLAFNNDGTKLFESGQDQLIYESTLSTPFDLSTATFQQSINSQDSFPHGIAFNDDGTKLFESGLNQANIFESTLSTPFDLSTATFQQSINSQDSVPQDLTFKPDGTKLYEIGQGSELIYESTLSTPFDLSTATFQQSISTRDADGNGIAFSNTGESLFEIGEKSDLIYESTLSTPFDLSTATFQQSIPTRDSSPEALAFSADGAKLFELGSSSTLIYEFTSELAKRFETF